DRLREHPRHEGRRGVRHEGRRDRRQAGDAGGGHGVPALLVAQRPEARVPALPLDAALGVLRDERGRVRCAPGELGAPGQAVMARRAVCAVAAAALVVVASACAGSGPDKAGGQPERPKPADKAVVLTLATGDPPFAEEYAKAVDRLSAGAIRIDIRLGRTAQRNYERFTVEDVRTGRAQLGSVAVRVWDTLGVTSMQALVAPLLVDDLELQKRLLQGPLATRMLRGLDRAGVVGLALTPGPLRRPIGVTRFFAGPKDYRGATMGIKFGNVARATFEALGARVTGYTSGQARFDGAELDLKTIADAKYDPRATAITANVVLWPRPQTIFANRAAFAKLTSGQQEILRRAGREAVPAEAARIAREEKDALSAVCSR